MKITYDGEGDVLYIELRHVRPSDSIDIEDGVTIELDAGGHVVAIEVLDASERLSKKELATVTYKNLVSGDSGTATISVDRLVPAKKRDPKSARPTSPDRRASPTRASG